MAKQTINIGTSANKGDGDPLRTAFDKVNDNFTEVYSDITRLNSVSFGGGTLTVDTIGNVNAHDSTLLVDANNAEIVGPIASTAWSTPQDISITSSLGNVDVSAQQTLTLENNSGDDYITISNSGILVYSDTSVAIRTAGSDIQIGFDTASGNTNIGHNSSTTFIYGSLDVNRFEKVTVPSYTTVERDGLANPDGTIIYNSATHAVEARINNAWVKLSKSDISEFTDNTNIIPSDIGDLTDNGVRLKSDISQLTDLTNRIPTDIGDLLSGGSVGQVVTRTSTGYGWTSVLTSETMSLGILKLHLGLSDDFDDFKSRILAL